MESDGAALAAVAAQALESLGEHTGGVLISDANGQTWRAADLGHAIARVQQRYPVGSWPLEIPAVSFGDTGAAAGVLNLALAARAFEHGYSKADVALVMLTSDTAERAAFAVGR